MVKKISALIILLLLPAVKSLDLDEDSFRVDFLPPGTQENATFNMSLSKKFYDNLSSLTEFPVTLKGHCWPGSQKLISIYRSYNVTIAYEGIEGDYQGHVWILVENPEEPDTYFAIDSYSGIKTSPEYYRCRYCINGKNAKSLESAFPGWNITAMGNAGFFLFLIDQ